MQDYIFVGVAGGTGSGKTTVSNNILQAFNEGEVAIIEQDSYYKNHSHLTYEERSKLNFDHPDSIDFELLISHLIDLKNGNTIEKPIYDFKVHARKSETEQVKPCRIIVVEGILIFAIKELRDIFDIKIFVDTDDDERLLRRIERDIEERGRTFESVKTQYLSTVKPMYLKYVEPSKRHSDIIIPRGGNNSVAINMIVAKLKALVNHHNI